MTEHVRPNNVEEKPGSATSRKEKEKDGLKSPDLVEVKGGGYSKRCVLPTVCLSVLLSALVGAGIFFLVYHFVVEFSYCPWTQMTTGCYQFFQDSKNWSEAQSLCRRRGGRLAELEGFDKQMDVVNLYSNGGHRPSLLDWRIRIQRRRHDLHLERVRQSDGQILHRMGVRISKK